MSHLAQVLWVALTAALVWLITRDLILVGVCVAADTLLVCSDRRPR